MIVAIKCDPSQVIVQEDGMILLHIDDPEEKVKTPLLEISVCKGETVEDFRSADMLYAHKRISLGAGGGIASDDIRGIPVTSITQLRKQRDDEELTTQVIDMLTKACEPMSTNDIKDEANVSEYRLEPILRKLIRKKVIHVVGTQNQVPLCSLADRGAPLITEADPLEREYQAIAKLFEESRRPVHSRRASFVSGAEHWSTLTDRLYQEGRIEAVLGAYRNRFVPAEVAHSFAIFKRTS